MDGGNSGYKSQTNMHYLLKWRIYHMQYCIYYLELSNKGAVVVSMKARHILSKILPSDWVALNSGYIGTFLILSVDHQLGASFHTAHSVAGSEGVSASMLQFCGHKYQGPIFSKFGGVVILHLPPIEEPSDSRGGAATSLHHQANLLSLQTLHFLLVINNGWWGVCVCTLMK